MTLDIYVEPYDNVYRLMLKRISFGAPTRKTTGLKPPKYPELAQRAGIEALVVLALELNDEGEVVSIHPEQTSLSGTGRERIVQQWREIFVENARATAKHWKFTIEEIINNKNQQSSIIRVPIEYRLDGGEGWRQKLVPVKISTRPLPQQDISQLDSLKNGEFESISSNFKLQNQLVGTYL